MNTEPLDLKAAELLRLIDEGTASVTGEAFFRALVRKLSEGMQTRYTFVAEFDAALTRASVLAWWDSHGNYREPFTFPLKGTPCELVATGSGDIVSYEADVAVCFPDDRAALERIGAKSYVAVPLMRPDGRVMGHLAVFDDRERAWDPMSLGLLRIFARAPPRKSNDATSKSNSSRPTPIWSGACRNAPPNWPSRSDG